MSGRIKKLLPVQAKEWLRSKKTEWLDNPRKKKLFLNMQKKHSELLLKIKGKKKIKIVFLAIHKSIWKVDPLFQKMLRDEFFDPLILICPYTSYGEERMRQDMRECFEYFQEKGYPVLSSFHDEESRWITLKELRPDIVFFTNPHNLTRKEYYQDVYLNYLSCYVPYYSDVASAYDVESSYNQFFHNSVWRIFYGDEISITNARKYSMTEGRNCRSFGSVFLEGFFSKNINYSAWKSKDKKKIVYAPHQSIVKENNLHLSTFLKVADFMTYLAEKYKDKVEWCFRPHPILKSKLYSHPQWGMKRTDTYYSFWANSETAHISDGDYVGLFKSTDAIIHDCGSFVLESLLSRKPSAYLHFNGRDQLAAMNDFGLELISYHQVLEDFEAIEAFINSIINGECSRNLGRIDSVEKELYPRYEKSKPTDMIISELKRYG